MAERILQVNFQPPAGLDMSSPGAQKANEESGELGGIYLFEDDGALKEYLKGPTIAQVKSMMQHVILKEFGVIEELTQATRGPV